MDDIFKVDRPQRSLASVNLFQNVTQSRVEKTHGGKRFKKQTTISLMIQAAAKFTTPNLEKGSRWVAHPEDIITGHGCSSVLL